jgi:uncharacterized protein (DUF433 family)
MEGLLGRIDSAEGAATLRSRGLPVAQILARLEVGESPARLVSAAQIDAADLIAALAFDALGDAQSEGPSLVQTAPKRPRLGQALRPEALAELLPNAKRPALLSLTAGLCLIQDFWEASHQAAQEADDLGERSFAAYWHGIAHRREPDAGNAAYWFRRVGRHAVFPVLAEATRLLLDAPGDTELTAKLIPTGGWDPYVMIDLCTQAHPGTPGEAQARRIQRLEMLALLGPTATAAGVPGCD